MPFSTMTAPRPPGAGAAAGGEGSEELLTARRAAALVALFTALGFVLRLAGLGQTLVDDEIFTYDIVTQNGLVGVVREVHHTSITPPLHYLLAHVAVQVGDPTRWIRVPSLVLGTATIPLVYALGSRTAGRAGGVVGAALFALSPFAVWYGVEARAYATLAFLVVLSTYALVRALAAEERGVRWWAVFVASSAGVLYSHYTGVFVLGVQGVWAAWVCWGASGRRGLRPLAIAYGLVALAYVPWIPAYLDQHDNKVGTLAINFLHPLTFRNAWQNEFKLLGGQPFVPWDDLLGPAGLGLLAAALVAALAGLLARARARGWRAGPREAAPAGLVLVGALAVATPLGLMLYALYDTSLYAPRNLLASLPALCLLLGAAVARVRPPLGAVAAACLVAAVALSSVRGLDRDSRRPPYGEVARVLDREAEPGDAIMLLLAGGDVFGRNPARRSLELAFERPHPSLVSAVAADRNRYRRVLDRAARRRRLFVVVAAVPEVPPAVLRERLGPRFRLVSQRMFPGYAAVRLAVYATPAARRARAAG